MNRLLLLASLAFLTISFPAEAQFSKKKKQPAPAATPADSASKEKKDESKKKWDEIVKKSEAKKGLFDLFRDTLTGKTYMALNRHQLGKEYIYFSYVEDGLVELGLNKGSYRGSKVIRFERNYDRLEIIHINTGFYFDPQSPLSRAAEANINNPVLASLKIEGEDKGGGKILVDADAIFLTETVTQLRRPARSDSEGGSRSGGSLSKEKTVVTAINNYPENTEITVRYVFDNPSGSGPGGESVTDGRSIAVMYQHSLLQMPDDGYVPRADDPRVGYFNTKVNDMTSFGPVKYRDVIHRWRLEKKDPNAEISEPVKPITWWVENTTPVEFREIVKEAVETWNIAFEKIGFKNAVVCYIQPDDADWDAGDIRYNVIRWTSSPNPPFGGYGPSFVNPRTGEIMGADIMIELSSITNRVIREQIFTAAMNSDIWNDDPNACMAGLHMNHSMHLAGATMRVFDFKNISEREFTHQFLKRLILHEVGHTLGLMHNMRASSIHTPQQLKDPEYVKKHNLTNSVMEYPAIHFGLAKSSHPIFFDHKPGAYDMWVIEYGYSPRHSDPIMEEIRLRNILERSSDPFLTFGNDADDMRGNGGIDPDINIYDLSSDPVTYAAERCDLIKEVMKGILPRYTHSNHSYQELKNVLGILVLEYSIQARIMTRPIGGVSIDRSYFGQPTSKQPLAPVNKARQKAAMKALNDHVFAPEALAFDAELLRHSMPQRRGFDHFSDQPDPKSLDAYVSIYGQALDHFFNPNTSKRISNSQFYGNTYALDEVMDDLTASVFSADLKGKVNEQRKLLQTEYVRRLLGCLAPKTEYTDIMKGQAVFQLNRIKSMMAGNPGSDSGTKAHRQYIVHLVDEGLKSK